MKRFFFILFIVLAACGPATTATPQLLKVYATSAASPWLEGVYACAPDSLAVALSDPLSAQLTIRLGEPSPLTSPAYQIGTEDLLVVIDHQAGISTLTADQVRGLFLGQILNWKDAGGNDLAVQVWSYASGEDVQQIFEQSMMKNQQITSLARLAVSAQNMSDSVGNNSGSIGLLPRRWKAGNVQEAYKVGTVPVLVITPNEPQGAIKELIACLQAK